ncbi:2-oxoacid:acceptor oxidoreductase subunit alpha [Candidatus Dojkabacteria bacterium]|uniref:2-oxoacid:acceptor oxidoreductase subunit alpha n=1 Tax=Candidatus Dojkabacteria bacterium TaxID=2099670 RepID=A0A955L319_9BACT|nr:2-oxoacid:acceptor oxidoreductase subunit alpha [Candidatus Dojkabacteria bacterium]
MPRNSVSVKIGGPAGYGIKTTGQIFSKLCLREGLNVFDTIEYPSLIRGGHNVYYALAEQRKALSHHDGLDFLIALNTESVRIHRDELSKGAGILYDPDKLDLSKTEVEKSIHLYPVSINKLAIESTGKDIARNTVALGAMACILGFSLQSLNKTIREIFGVKSKDIADMNVKAATAGYDFAKKNFNEKFEHKIHSVKRINDKRLLITGNEAIALGAIAASCSFYAAYPMTPSSSILHYLAENAEETGMVVKHAEDEISVINMAIGSSYAGVRSMCATSGGGFALMNEGFGLAGITETPLVVAEVQRPGPATGLPTWHGQGDLQFVLHAAQGEFPRVIVAPGDPTECFYETFEAFNIADKFQLPVVVLSDKYLAESTFTIRNFETDKLKINRGKIASQADLSKLEGYKRYQFSKDGVSLRSIPGLKKGRFLANSDEHDEFGYSSEDAENAAKQMEKRMQKEKELLKYLPDPVLKGPKNAKITFVSWGSTKGAILEAMEILKAQGIETNLLQMKYLWPFKADVVKRILKDAKKLVLIEGNYNGQLGKLIRQETGVEIKKKILTYDGRPVSPERIVAEVR